MSRRPGTRALILVEDRAFENLVRRVCLQVGLKKDEIYVVPYPKSHGSAEQWVRKNYPDQVRAYRTKANHRRIVLIVGTDADSMTIDQRRQTLESSLGSSGLSARAADERIVIWIPKRMIETWLLFLSGEAVTEEDFAEKRDQEDAKRRAKDINIKQTAIKFVECYRRWSRREVISGLLPSLEAAFREARDRLPFT